MRIDKITIEGYRRFNKSTINLNHGNFAILAGAHNSGKTIFLIMNHLLKFCVLPILIEPPK